MNDQVKIFIIGFVTGAFIFGGITYLWMNQQLQAEIRKVEIGQQLLNTTIDQIPKPPFPPDIE
ncbi:MAG TPA: hypothetical protein VJI96_00650 [Candidatus Andersenbacteria bacterium]|nr:hypothetical protein [Candidatus Andersenbacteria bacterium]